eukprot:752522-Hanusia_phi.AAC.1
MGQLLLALTRPSPRGTFACRRTCACLPNLKARGQTRHGWLKGTAVRASKRKATDPMVDQRAAGASMRFTRERI